MNFSIVAESETVTELFSYLITQCTGREIYLSQQLSLFRLLMTNKIGMKRLLTTREIENDEANERQDSCAITEWMNEYFSRAPISWNSRAVSSCENNVRCFVECFKNGWSCSSTWTLITAKCARKTEREMKIYYNERRRPLYWMVKVLKNIIKCFNAMRSCWSHKEAKHHLCLSLWSPDSDRNIGNTQSSFAAEKWWNSDLWRRSATTWQPNRVSHSYWSGQWPDGGFYWLII